MLFFSSFKKFASKVLPDSFKSLRGPREGMLQGGQPWPEDGAWLVPGGGGGGTYLSVARRLVLGGPAPCARGLCTPVLSRKPLRPLHACAQLRFQSHSQDSTEAKLGCFRGGAGRLRLLPTALSPGSTEQLLFLFTKCNPCGRIPDSRIQTSPRHRLLHSHGGGSPPDLGSSQGGKRVALKNAS